MFTLLRIHFYPFSYQSIIPVHTAPDTFENVMKTMKRSHCSALDKKENATTWFKALATAYKLFKQLTATNIPPSSMLTSSESAMLRKVVQIGAVQVSCCVVVVVVVASVSKSIRFRCSHCVFAFSKVSVFKVRFQKSRVVFKVEQCERKAQTDTFLSIFI